MIIPIASGRLTEDQRQTITRIASHALERACRVLNLDNSSAQRIIDDSGEVGDALVAQVRSFSSPKVSSHEEVVSTGGYSSRYKPRRLADQMNRLREFFPEVNNASTELAEGALPVGAEGWFAIPRWELMGPNYASAVARALEMMKACCPGRLSDCSVGRLDAASFRQTKRTARMYRQLGHAQGGFDTLVIPCQLGIRHRGRSVRYARARMCDCEFGLGAFAVAMIILTHPERLQESTDLWIDCAGDEFDTDCGWPNVPYFNILGETITFGTGWFGDVDGRFGSASGFLAQ